MDISLLPAEANSPLVVDPNAVLAGSVPGETLQSVPGWHPQLVQLSSGVQEQKFAVRPSLEVRGQLWCSLTLKHPSGLGVAKRPNHDSEA
jgi:hypothetical protein